MNFIEKMSVSLAMLLGAIDTRLKAEIEIPDKALGDVISGIKDAVQAKKIEPYVQTGMYLLAGLIIAILLLVVVLIFKKNNKSKGE